MSKKETSKTSAKNGLDSDLDFDGFDDFSEFESTNAAQSTKNRKPLASAFKGTIKGAAKSTFSKNTANKFLKNALPSEYGDVLNTASEVGQGVSDIYRDAVTTLKPTINKIAKEVDKLVPNEMKRSKGLLDKVKKLSAGDQGSYDNTAEIREQGINSTLSEIFKIQTEQQVNDRARDKAEEQINSKVEADRHKDNYTLFNSMNMGINRLVNYNEKINALYQKKSLELQLRSYYTQVDILENSKRFYSIFQKQFEGIQLNTALPEFQKITKSEMLKQQLGNKFIGTMGNNLFGPDSLLAKGFGRLKKKASSKVRDIKDAFESGLFGLEAYNSNREIMKEMGTNGHEMLGEAAGTMGVEYLAQMLGKKVFNNIKDGKIHRGVQKAANFTNDIQGSVKKLLESDYFQDDGSGGPIGLLKKLGKEILSSFLNVKETTKFEKNSLNTINKPAIFDNSVKRSIVEVIPGYLARILREQTIIRTGFKFKDKDIQLLHFDHDSGNFLKESEYKRSIEKSIKDGLNIKKRKLHEDNFAELVINDNNLTHEQQHALRHYDKIDFSKPLTAREQEIVKHYQSIDFKSKNTPTSETEAVKEVLRRVNSANNGFGKDNFLDHKHYAGFDEETAKKVKSHYNKAFNKLGRSNDVIKTAVDYGSTLGDSREAIQNLINIGRLDLLPKNLVTKNEKGELILNDEEYEKLSTTGISDYNAKQNISRVDGGGILSKFKKLATSAWDYRKGRGDGGSHIAPMAQDLNKQFGPQVAPDGKKVDLISANGVNMAAISELSREQDLLKNKIFGGIGTSDTKHVTKAIGLSTKTIVDKLNEVKLGLAGSLISAILPSGLSQKEISRRLNNAKHYLNTKGSELKSVGKELADKVSGSVKDYKDHGFNEDKEFVKGKFNTLGEWIKSKQIPLRTKNMAIKTKDFLHKHAKNGFNIGKNFVEDLYHGTSAGLKNIADTPQDIYILRRPGVPTLYATEMAKGNYLLKENGKPITRPHHITGAVLDEKGNEIISLNDLSQGLYDKEGNKIRSPLSNLSKRIMDKLGILKNGIFDKLKLSFNNVKAIFNKAKDFAYNIVDTAEDIYVHGKADPVLYATSMKAGHYFLKENGKVIKKPSDITGAVVDHEGNVVLSYQDFQKGLIDKDGKPIKSPLSKLTSTIIGAGMTGYEFLKSSLGNIMEGLKNKGKGGLNSIKNLFKGFGGGNKETNKLLKDIRDMLNDRMPGEKHEFNDNHEHHESGGHNGFMGPMQPGGITGAVRNIKQGAQNIRDKFNDFKSSESGQKLQSGFSNFKDRFSNSKFGQRLANTQNKFNGTRLGRIGGRLRAGGKGLFGKLSGFASGFFNKENGDRANPLYQEEIDSMRNAGLEGGGEDQILSEQKNAHLAEGDKNLKDGLQNRIDATNAARQSRIDRVKQAAMNAANTGAKYMNGGNVLQGMMDMAGKAVGALSGGLSTIATLFKTVGGPVGNIAKGIFSAVTGGGGILKTGLSVARFGLGLGLDAAIAAGSAALGAATTVAGALISAFAVPVLIGAAAIGAGYLIYKGYKYLTRDDANNLELFRLAQYGFGKQNQKYFHNIYNLEGVLSEEALAYQPNGTAFLIQNKIDPEEIYKTFGLTKDSQEAGSFMEWFNKRFKPVFLTHMTALKTITGNKPKISDAKGLKDEQLDKFLKAVRFEEGPYDQLISPVKNVDLLTKPYVMAAYKTWEDEAKANSKEGKKNQEQANINAISPSSKLKDDQIKAAKAKEAAAKKDKDEKDKLLKVASASTPATKKDDYSKSSNFNSDSDTPVAPTTPNNPNISSFQNSVNSAKNVAATYGDKGSSFSSSSVGTVSDKQQAMLNISPDAGDYQGIHATIDQASKAVGVNPNMIKTMAVVESSLNPNARAGTSSAGGLYQFLDGTWKDTVKKYGSKYGLTEVNYGDKFNVMKSSLMMGEFTKENLNAISGVKKDPNVVDLYLAHFLGSGGAKKFLSADPNAIAADVMGGKVANANKAVFFEDRGMGRPRTISEVYASLNKRLRASGSKFGVDVPIVGFSGTPSSVASGGQEVKVVQNLDYNTEIKRMYSAPSQPAEAPPPSRPLLPTARQNSPISANTPSTVQDSGTRNNSLSSSVVDAIKESTGIQTEMRDILKDILGAMSPENLNGLIQNLSTGKGDYQNVNAKKGSRGVTPGGVDLSRTLL